MLAPFPGQVVSVSIDPFQEVSGNSEAVLLQSSGALDVGVLVPETMIRDIDYGQAVQVTFPTLPDTSVQGVVHSIGADTAAGNAFAVKIRLTPTEADLRAGMTASATFNFTAHLDGRRAYLIPLSAMAIDAALARPEAAAPEDASDKRAPLFVYDPADKKLHFRMVSIGDLRGNEIEVFDGLEPGDQVVSAGTAFLRDGMAARVWTPRQ